MIPQHLLSNHLFIVNFHHVRPSNPKNFPFLHHRTVEQFINQLKHLGQMFDFVSPSKASELIASQDAPSKSVCMITLDDGLKDHYEFALPLLESLGIQALFCINTKPWDDGKLLSVHMAHLLSAAFSYEALAADFEQASRKCGLNLPSIEDVPEDRVRQQYRYDSLMVGKVKFFLNALIPQERREEVLRIVFNEKIGGERELSRAHYLSLKMVKEMHERGQEFGLHTHSHLHLASAPSNLREEDLKKNKRYILEAIGPGQIKWVSYPYGSPGSFNDQVVLESEELGCNFGLAMVRGVNNLRACDRMRLKRLDTNDAPGGKDPISLRELGL